MTDHTGAYPKLRRRDVPYYVRPPFVRVAAILWLCAWAGLLVTVERARPGIVELLVGLGMGAPAGLAYSAMLVRSWASLEGKARERWSVGGVAYWCNLGLPLAAKLERLALAALVLAGLFGTSAVLAAVSDRWPDLSWPLARFAAHGTDSPIAPSIPSAFLVYAVFAGLSVALRVQRWYRSLPG